MGTSLPEKALSDRHLIAIATVITRWSAFERVLRMLAFGITTNRPVDEEGDLTAAIVYEGMQTRALIQMVQTLAQYRFPQEKELVKKFAERVYKAKRERDLYSHAMFDHGSKPGSIRPILAKTLGGLKQATGDITVEDIENWAKEIGQLMLIGTGILVRWGYLIVPDEPWSETPDEPNPASPQPPEHRPE